LKSAFAIFGISEIVFLFWGINPLISGLILCIIFVIINIFGVKEAVIFQNILVTGLLLLMMTYMFFGLPSVDSSRLAGVFSSGINTIVITAGFVFISYGGLLQVVNVSEEIKNPKKNIPLGIISSITVVTIIYTIMTYIMTGTLPIEEFSGSLTPVADSARLFMGTPGFWAISIASLIAFVTTANAGIMAASRYPLALSRENLLPSYISKINKRFKTPSIAIILTGIFIYSSLLLPLEMLVKAASTVVLTSYVLTNLAVIIFRESRIINYKPSFKTPFYPWLQIITIISFTLIIADIGLEAVEISLSLLFTSLIIYFLYGRKAKDKEYAFLHLMRRIVDSKLHGHILEDELRDVLINRDSIEQDNFDKLVRGATIIDIEKGGDYNYLIDSIMNQLIKHSGMEADELKSRYLKGQENNNFAISDFLAIPHIVIDGQDKTFLLIIRSKEGIRFTEKEDSVKAIFVLGGTNDRRVVHLRNIASIASLVYEKNFQESWENAKNDIELKSLMLLSSRRRYFSIM
jgi:amino acid transporter